MGLVPQCNCSRSPLLTTASPVYTNEGLCNFHIAVVAATQCKFNLFASQKRGHYDFAVMFILSICWDKNYSVVVTAAIVTVSQRSGKLNEKAVVRCPGPDLEYLGPSTRPREGRLWNE
jgi:hypothetical protein